MMSCWVLLMVLFGKACLIYLLAKLNIDMKGREVGGLHNRTCHSCKKVGALLECHNCPRSYHRRCLNPPIHGNFKIDGDWYCPNCEVLGLDLRERSVTVKVEDGVTPLHRIDITDERRNSGSEEKKGKKSKYTILPENVDEALGLLNRELQVAYQMKGVIAEMAAKLEVVEQQLRIQKGRADLLTLERMAGGAENERKLKTENTRLRKELEILKEEARRKEVELAEWKSSVKAIVDGK